jgi:hypothetical protein
METLGLGDGHHGTGIIGRVYPELEAGICLNLHEKGGELCFGHAALLFLQPNPRVLLRTWCKNPVFGLSFANAGTGYASTEGTGSGAKSDRGRNAHTGGSFSGLSDHKIQHHQPGIPDLSKGHKSKAKLLTVHGDMKIQGIHIQPAN